MRELADFKSAFDPLFIKTVTAELRHITKLASNTPAREIMLHIKRLLPHGKRLRPFLVAQMAGTTQWNSDHINVMCAVELFHIFCLVHDDIIDHSPMRHGMPTIHTALAAQAKDADYGNAQALLAGDLIMVTAWQLANTITSASLRNSVITIFQELASEVIIGQMVDVHLSHQQSATRQELLFKNKYKTARYTFVHPMKLGVMLSQKNIRQNLQFAERFGVEAGIAFQISDDRIDVLPKTTGKTQFLDVAEGQPTYASEFILHHPHTPYRAALKGSFGKKRTFSSAEISKLQKLFTDTGALQFLETELQKHVKKAKRILKSAKELNPVQRNTLDSILEFLQHRTQ